MHAIFVVSNAELDASPRIDTCIVCSLGESDHVSCYMPADTVGGLGANPL